MSKEMSQMRSVRPRQLLYQIAQEEIKHYIIQNGLKPGDALPPESDLSHQLNISRNSVREAVKSLEAVGILEARSGSGIFVRDFTFEPILNNLPYGILSSLKHLTDILEIRALLESGMADRIVASVTEEQIEEFRLVLARMYSAAERGDYSAEDDREFHQLLYRRVDNLLLPQIVDIFWVVFRQAQQHAAIPGPLNPMETYRCHVDIVDALEKGDLNAMRAAMARHYEGISRRIRLAQQVRSDAQPPLSL
jgi:DNA-binding FadR family transcriptional regulator